MGSGTPRPPSGSGRRGDPRPAARGRRSSGCGGAARTSAPTPACASATATPPVYAHAVQAALEYVTRVVVLHDRLQDRRRQELGSSPRMRLFRRLLPLAVLAALLGGSVPAHGQESLRERRRAAEGRGRRRRRRRSPTRAKASPTPNAGSRVLDARARKRRQQLSDTQDKLVDDARAPHAAGEASRRRPRSCSPRTCARATWTASRPSSTVVLNADGFSDLVERFEFLRRDLAPQRLRARRHARRADQGQGHDGRPQGRCARPTARSRATPTPTATAPTRSAPRCSTASRTSCASATAPRPSSPPCAARSPRSSAARPRPPARPRAAATAANAGADHQRQHRRRRRRRRGRRRPRRRGGQPDRHDALRLGRRPRRRLRRLRLLRLDLLRARRGRPAHRLARPRAAS